MSWIDAHMSDSIGIDYGTDHISLYFAGDQSILREPSAAACLVHTNEIAAVGEDAERLLGRTPKCISLIYPVQNGVVTDYHFAEVLLRSMLEKRKKKGALKPVMMLTVPCGATDVEERALVEVAERAGARKTYLVETPVAAALGAGCDITLARGLMVLDIGGGVTNFAAISLCNTVIGKADKTAGSAFTDAVIRYLRRRHSVEIGRASAKRVKEEIGGVMRREQPVDTVVCGTDVQTHLPRRVRVYSEELLDAFEEPFQALCAFMKNTLDETPPDILGDIMEDGVLLTGGGAKLYGLERRLRRETGLKLFTAEEPELCAVRGCGIAIEHLDDLPGIVHSYHNI